MANLSGRELADPPGQRRDRRHGPEAVEPCRLVVAATRRSVRLASEPDGPIMHELIELLLGELVHHLGERGAARVAVGRLHLAACRGEELGERLGELERLGGQVVGHVGVLDLEACEGTAVI